MAETEATLDGDTRGVEVNLVRRAREGDAEAFGALYEMHLDRVYRYVAYRVRGDAEAEDLVEQVFLRAWEAMPRYEERGLPFASWLFRMAHNLVVDHYRTSRATVPLDSVEEMEASGNDADAEIAAKLAAEHLREALRQLKDEQQEVLLLRFVEELSHAEVAAVMGKSDGAVRVIQHRALASLAKLLGAKRGSDAT